MPKVLTHLWFDNQAEEAMNFYLSIFKDGKKLDHQTFTDTVPGTDGKQPLERFEFELDGHRIAALNAGPTDAFNARCSLQIVTKDQAETDYYWDALTADGGEEQPCGWLIDRFGVYWQVSPEQFLRLESDPDRDKADRALRAMYKMTRLIIADVEAAYRGEAGRRSAA
jgi:predicted 3-demethylubiquinone-9 3-methyltransferase (glyoxalase superfamily)